MAIPRVWPVQINPESAPIEHYGYDASVMRALSGQEQRAQLRRHPIGGIEAEYLCDVEQDAQAAATVLHGGQSDVWVVPLWMYAQPLLVDLTIGGVTIFVASTANIPFVDAAGYGGYVALWSSPLNYEAVELDSVSAPFVVAASPGVVKNWTAGMTYVVPTRVGRLAERIEYEWLTRSMLRARLRFEFEPDTILI